MKKGRNMNLYIIALTLLVIGLTAALVDADPNAPQSLNVLQTSNTNLSTQAAQGVGAQGGNVTEMNIAALTVTNSWQGYYGNITGTVKLQDAMNSTFYDWSLTSFNGRVFATRSQTVAWTTVNCTNVTNRSNEETYLGQVPTDSDSVTNTFNLTSHPTFNVSSRHIYANSCYSTFGYVNNNSQSANYSMVLLSHSNGQIIYTAIMNKSVVGFDGKQHDFQLLVGENEKSGSIGATTYYFWAEFS